SITGRDVPLTDNPATEGALLVGPIKALQPELSDALEEKLNALGPEGFVIQSLGGDRTLITSSGERGVLYGVFHFLRLVQAGHSIQNLSIEQKPQFHHRLLNHWDDMDGHIERGYAGRSLWAFTDWNGELPEERKRRIEDYARYCASVGINGAVLNNVNADPRLLRKDNLAKVTQVADILRPWGIRVFLTPNFASPLPPSDTPDKRKAWGGIGNLDTADPLDPAVQAWWKATVDEVYERIPDFGGFLVKANSEGMPGPADYNRTHAEGANMLARALKPYGGIVMWRAFVYGRKGDRARHAYDEFKPLDGMFDDNVYLQLKNGPIDFQPWEPIQPLFGAMPKTRLALELQITKEYLGQNKTMTYLGPMWAAILTADTYAKGKG
ncbi:MAG TPA: alpha-glucuronidase family glycosyl hydrolase, partial [Tichowtungia sp.]|nr:alpha-glucuronidase family glycosyl hydrolase [Tichowtungia sp.]